jgi:hypothetical protein
MYPHLEDPERLVVFNEAAESKEAAFYRCLTASKELIPHLRPLAKAFYAEEGLVNGLANLEDAINDATEAIERGLRIVTGAPLEKG